MSIVAMKPENTPNNSKKQQQRTDNQKNIKYQNVGQTGLDFYI